MNSSEFFNFLSTRSSVRDYTDRPVSTETINNILKCAQKAPSAGNREAWDVIVVTDEGIKEDLAEMAFRQEHIEKAPVILVVCANYVRSMSQYGDRGILYALEDATIAGTYMMLAAHAAGLSTCWTGAFDEEEVSAILDLPVHIRPITLLAAGYGHSPVSRTERMPLEEHLHDETW